ncbi:MAG: outer membrane beta-barrel protein [Xanthobacteraceae bacterium]
MNKNAIFAAAAFALVAISSAAHAADVPGASRPYAPPSLQSGYSWTGPYVGANLGYQSGAVTNNPTEPSGAFIGMQLGYNWHSGSLVFGGETDMQISGADDVLAPWKFSNPWFGTTRARVGYASNNILFYGTGGLAYGGLDLESAGLSQDKTHFGWTIGLGAEVGLTSNWTAKVEYLYIDLTDRNYFIGTANGLESDLFRLGVNYRF